MDEGSGADPGARACGGRCDVGVQWEEPEDLRCDVGVQSDTRWCDVAVQVDLIGLSCRTPGSSDVPWRCLTLRPEQTEGGTLWHGCAHGNGLLVPPPSAALLCPSPSRTPDGMLQTTLPSMHLSSPGRQSSLRLPSMPCCGDSPSSQHQGEEPQSTTPGPEGAEPHAPDGFMAPLSSDEDTLQGRVSDEKSPDAAIKKRRRRPKNSSSLSDPETTPTQKRRSKTGRAAGLPLRYLLDYDLESRDQLSANKQQPERGEGAELGTKQENTPKSDKKVLFLPYYKQSLNLEEFTEFQNMARQQYKTLQEEDDWPNSASVIMHPPLEQLMPRPLSPGEVLELNMVKKPRLLPLKLKKLKNNAKSHPPTSKKTPDWSIENAAIKEEPTDENADLESPDWSKTKITQIKVKKEPDSLKFNKVVIKQEDGADGEAHVDYLNPINLKDEILGTKSNNKKAKLDNYDVAKTSVGEGNSALIHVKRKRGRPKKRVKNPVEIKQQNKAEQDCETTLAEQPDRPRRATVRPPVRYILESEELNAGRQERLKLGDVLNGDADKAGMVKKVKILNGDADDVERRSHMNSLESVTEIKYEYEDIEDIYVLREDEYTTESQSECTAGDRRVQWADSKEDLRVIETDHLRGGAYDEQGQWERWNGGGADGEWVNEERRRGRRKKRCRNLKMDLNREVVSKFLVFKDDYTSAVTLIPPCSVKLHKLSNKEAEMIASTGREDE